MSALIFVAVAVAWAVYLVPKALRHHEEASASRTVEEVSERARVVARRDAVTARSTVLTPGAARARTVTSPAADLAPTTSSVTESEPEQQPDAAVEVQSTEVEQVVETRTVEVDTSRTTSAPRPAPAARRASARRAAQRRRRVLITLLALLAVVGVLAVTSVIASAWIAAPVALVVAWLAACRLMVRGERAARAPLARTTAPAAQPAVAEVDPVEAGDEDATGEVAAVSEAGEVADQSAPGSWAPVPVTLPTYVGKAAASRTVRTIDLDSTGVWSSGRNAGDSELARGAEAQQRTEREAAERRDSEPRRASGS